MLGVTGCQGEIGASSELVTTEPRNSSNSSNREGGAVVNSALTQCAGVVFQSSSAPLRRLSEDEYAASVGDLFPGVSLPQLTLVPDARVDGFTNAASGQAASPLAVEQFDRAASTVAAAAAGQRGAWAPCTDDTDTCVQSTLAQVAEKAFRHPLSSEERTGVDELATAVSGLGTSTEAIEAGLTAILQAPTFLYRPEFGSGDEMGTSAELLTGYELATRLSYFFTGSMPDDALMAAAASGELDSEAGLRSQAQRLLKDSRSRPVVTKFFLEWLRLYKLDELALDPNYFPEFDEAMRDDLKASAKAFVEYALWDKDSWRTLMSGSYGFVNDRLAPLFGVPAPGTDELTFTELDASERRGVLTQPAMLASTSHGIRHSPILRGVTMLNNILCEPPPAPPPGILAAAEDVQVDPSQICTTRDDVALTHTAKAGCQGCHASIDGAGFNFENYDALGRFRSVENDCMVDATGTFPGTDIEGEVVDAVHLADQLGDSKTVTGCFSEHLFRYALGRGASDADACEVANLAIQLQDGGDSLQGLVLNMVTSPSFRSRPQ